MNADDRKVMEMKNSVSTQVRIPESMYEYMKAEAERIGVSSNSFLVILLEQGRRLWEANLVTELRPKE